MRFEAPFDFGRIFQHARWTFHHKMQTDDSDEIMAIFNAYPLKTTTIAETPQNPAPLPA
jgi:hypothetical protein